MSTETPLAVTYTAMCLWEAVLEDQDGPWSYARKVSGTHTLRDSIASLAAACDEDWQALDPPESEECHPSLEVFDWEFCPVWLRVAVDYHTLPEARPAAERLAALKAWRPEQKEQ
jgi:hypothetical protein